MKIILPHPTPSSLPPNTSFFFFFSNPAPTEISTLPLHAALPIWPRLDPPPPPNAPIRVPSAPSPTTPMRPPAPAKRHFPTDVQPISVPLRYTCTTPFEQARAP